MWGVWRRWRSPNPPHPDDEIGEEIRDHLRRRSADLVARGLTPDAAARQAAIEFGGVEGYKEQARVAAFGRRVRIFFDHIALEFSHAIRRLGRTPLFATFSALSLAVGVGVTTGAYAVLDDSSHVTEMPDAEHILILRSDRNWRLAFPLEDVNDITGGLHSLAPLAYASKLGASFEWHDEGGIVGTEIISGDYFTVVHLTPVSGRLLGPSDDASSAAPAVVIGEQFWRDRLGADPEVIGTVGRLAGRSVTIVGIAPARFSGLASTQLHPISVWITTSAARQLLPLRNNIPLGAGATATIFGRLAPGRTMEGVSAELHAIARRLDENPTSSSSAVHDKPRVWSVTSAAADASEDQGPAFVAILTFTTIVGFVLAVASTNLANLFMARGARRQVERRIRRALGASRWRIFTECVAEASVLAVLGGIGSVILTQIALVACTRYVSYGYRSFYFAPHWTRSVWAVELTLLALSFACFGLIPAWRLSRASARPSTARLRPGWITLQVAIASSLLMISAMCFREFERTAQHDAGVDYQHVDVAFVSFVTTGWGQDRVVQSERAFVNALSGRPEFDGVAVSSTLPFGDAARPSVNLASADKPFPIDGASASAEAATLICASAGLFRTLDVDILRGRPLDDRDQPGPHPNVVIGARAARRLFGSLDVVDRAILLQRTSRSMEPSVTPATIVGVAESTDISGLYETQNDAVYVPLGQYETLFAAITARTGDPVRHAGLFERTIRRTEPDVAVLGSGPGPETLSGDYVALAPMGEVFTGLGLGALLLAMAGLYGVVLDVVTRRFPEMGIRLALGADPARLIRLIIGEGVRPVLWGLPIGLVAATLGRKLLQRAHPIASDLLDPVTLSAASVPFLLAALLACYWPARRASRVDPTIVLRAE